MPAETVGNSWILSPIQILSSEGIVITGESNIVNISVALTVAHSLVTSKLTVCWPNWVKVIFPGFRELDEAGDPLLKFHWYELIEDKQESIFAIGEIIVESQKSEI